jgi:hypothetical protein
MNKVLANRSHGAHQSTLAPPCETTARRPRPDVGGLDDGDQSLDSMDEIDTGGVLAPAHAKRSFSDVPILRDAGGEPPATGPVVQRYLIGPPQQVDASPITGPTYGPCRNFNLVVSWTTGVRNGFILQECMNTDTITRCSDGANLPAPNTPHYWEAWQVDGSGAVSDGNQDTWFRAQRPGTQGRWTFDSNVFAVSQLNPAWGFARGAVPTAGTLLATTTGPGHDELYQPSMTRHQGGEWDCCAATPYHRPI